MKIIFYIYIIGVIVNTAVVLYVCLKDLKEKTGFYPRMAFAFVIFWPIFYNVLLIDTCDELFGKSLKKFLQK